MTVYILTKGWHYEGGTVVGVFEVPDDAMKAPFSGDYMEIEEWQTGDTECRRWWRCDVGEWVLQ